jgi:hypothetical protein
MKVDVSDLIEELAVQIAVHKTKAKSAELPGLHLITAAALSICFNKLIALVNQEAKK